MSPAEQIFLKDQRIVVLEAQIDRLNARLGGLMWLLEIADYQSGLRKFR